MHRRKERTGTEIKNRLRVGIRREDKKLFGLAQDDLLNQRLKPGPCTRQYQKFNVQIK